MQRIATPTASSDHKFLPGDGGTFRGTQFSAAWCNAVQEEIAGFIESAGLELDDDGNNQLFAAFSAMLAAGFSVSGDINFIGQGGGVKVGHDGVSVYWGEGSSAHSIAINGQGINVDGVKIEKKMESGVPVIEIDKTLSLLENLIVSRTATFNGSINALGGVSGSVTGNVTGNSTGVHYGNVHSDNILPMTNGGNVGITRPNVNGKATFNNECVYPKILLTSGTYSSELLDNIVYTTMSEGSIVYALNGYNGNAGIKVSSTNIVIVKPGTGVALMKSSSGKWYPLSPDVTLTNI